MYECIGRKRKRDFKKLEAMDDKIDKASIIRGMKCCCQDELIAKGTLEACTDHSLFDLLVIKKIGEHRDGSILLLEGRS